MFDVWHSVRELRQPCLTQRLTENLIGTDGMVRPQVLRSLDTILLERVVAALPVMPVVRPGRNLSDEERWINVSALQKAIRRGDVKRASDCAANGWRKDADHVFRRLAVCGVEDVGIGNLLTVATALAIVGNAKIRHGPFGEMIASRLAADLAGSLKSRLACDLLSIVEYDGSLTLRKKELAEAATSELAELANDASVWPAERMIALWQLAGTRRFRSATMPDRVGSSRRDAMRIMAAKSMPLILYYIADRTGGRLSDAMFLSYHLIWEWVRTEKEIRILQRGLPASPIIRGFPAYSYDAHTREGRRALLKMPLECPTVSVCVGSLSPSQRAMALAHGIFLIEGGLLDSVITFPQAEIIEQAAHNKELEICGLKRGDQANFLEALDGCLPALNDFRLGALVA